jgi:hypothetical protein
VPIDGPFREFYDTELVCQVCQQPFIFEAGEAAFFADSSRQWPPPTRCKLCRAGRKTNRWATHIPVLQEVERTLIELGKGALAKELTFVINDCRKLTDYVEATR